MDKKLLVNAIMIVGWNIAEVLVSVLCPMFCDRNDITR